MRNTLLTTTALVLSAGIASADGHATVSWSGTATAGVARDGAVQKAAAGKATVSGLLASTNAVADAAITTDLTDATYKTQVTAQQAALANTIETVLDDHGAAVTMTSTPTLAQLRADIVKLYASIAGVTSGNSLVAAEKVKLNAVVAILDGVHGTAAVVEGKSGDFKSYSEVNATVTGSVTAGDVTMTAAMSVDAGAGYTFADDKTFDTASAGRVGLDNVTIATSMGTFKIDDGAIVHLVDAGDETNADILYTNTFGSMSVSVAIDANKDTDLKAAKAVDAVLAYADGLTAVKGLTTVTTVGVAAVAADVAWSAKVSMPVAGGTAYIAMDEEGGNIFGASTTLSGVGISFSSKLEALEEEISADRDNSIGLTYALGATKLGATWNSVEDGDQWGISAAYTADGMTINASTDEGSDWSVSGSYLMGTGASVVGGVNYTEDAYLGLSFSF